MSSVSFNGIFTFYHTYYPRTSIQKFVKVKTSSDYGGRGSSYSVVDPNITMNTDKMNWLSKSEENSSFMIIFQRDILKLSSYSLKARVDQGFNTPREWVLEGSNDLMNWKQLHHKERGDELTTIGSEGNWSSDVNEYFRMFRLMMLGENKMHVESEKYIFSMNKLEVFGTLHPFVKMFSCKCKQNIKSSTVLLLIIMIS